MRWWPFLLMLIGCGDPTEEDPDAPTVSVSCDTTEQLGATDTSHSKGEADASVLMGDAEVPRLDLVICPDDWATALADLDNLYGSSGGPGGPGGGDFADDDPIYIPATLVMGDQVWAQVGFRFKGNSSLSSAVRQGVEKYPFRLDLDRYEDDFPELEDQRFYGFGDLKFSSGYLDSTFQRDKLAADVFRDAGVPAARGGFVRIHVDTGDGPVYWGLYTVFEDPAGEMLDDWFGDDSGNAYQPEDGTADLQSFDAADFQKKTNEDEADFSDVIAFIDALNAWDADPEAWRAGLEATFDMDGFIRYLALNNLIGNWDAYGVMAHNYYLYGDPADGGRLTWIPWDFNEAWGGGSRQGIDLDLSNVSPGWPLLEAVRDDPVYRAQYEAEIDDLLQTVFTSDGLQERIDTNFGRLAEYADQEEAPYTNATQDIDSATAALGAYVATRVGIASP